MPLSCVAMNRKLSKREEARDVEIVRVSRLQIACVLGPGLLSALLLGLLFWPFLDILRALLVLFASSLVTAISLNIFVKIAGRGPTIEIRPAPETAEEDTLRLPADAAVEPESEPAPDADEPAEEHEDIEGGETECLPHWSESPYPDPDEELGTSSNTNSAP